MNGNVLEVKVRKLENVVIIDLAGDFTLLADDEVSSTIKPLVDEGVTKIVLNFSSVGYINSSGIAILIGLVTLVGNKGGRIKAYGLIPHFQKVFNMVGLTRYMDLYENEEEAVESFGL